MTSQFTDTHIQLESGNDVYDGVPRQLVRREFEQGVVWFEKPIVMGEDLDRIGRSKAEQLERKFAEEIGESGRQILDPKDF